VKTRKLAVETNISTSSNWESKCKSSQTRVCTAGKEDQELIAFIAPQSTPVLRPALVVTEILFVYQISALLFITITTSTFHCPITFPKCRDKPDLARKKIRGNYLPVSIAYWHGWTPCRANIILLQSMELFLNGIKEHIELLRQIRRMCEDVLRGVSG